MDHKKLFARNPSMTWIRSEILAQSRRENLKRAEKRNLWMTPLVNHVRELEQVREGKQQD